MVILNITGASLASLLHRASSSAGDTHGYIFGHAAVSTSNPLSDHPAATAPTSLLVATITSFLSLPSHLPLPPPPASATTCLLGCFSARRKTPLLPSLKDSAAARSLSSTPSLSFTPQNSTLSLPPSLLLLITTPFQDQLIHTRKAFQYGGSSAFEAKSLSIVNIGPSFRSQYDSFSPSVPFPMMDFESRGPSAMVEELPRAALGFDIGRLGKLMGTEAAYAAEMEELPRAARINR